MQGDANDREGLEALIRRGDIDTVLTVFPDGLGRIARGERGAQVRVCVRVIRSDANRLSQRGNASVVVTGLDEHESEIVVSFGVIGAETNRFAELCGDTSGGRAGAPEHEPQDVVGVRPRRCFGERLAKGGNGDCPVRFRW